MTELWIGGAGSGFTRELKDYMSEKMADLANEELGNTPVTAKKKNT